MICHSPRPSVSRPRRRAGVATPTRRAATPAALPFSVLRRTKCNESPVKTSCKSKKLARCYHSNQQYSIITLTDNTGAITERYAYSAYGEPVFVSATGTVLAASAEDNHYTHTGREWDEGLGLYHFRARMYDAGGGRFLGRDPASYIDAFSLYMFFRNSPIVNLDPFGLATSFPKAEPRKDEGEAFDFFNIDCASFWNENVSSNASAIKCWKGFVNATDSLPPEDRAACRDRIKVSCTCRCPENTNAAHKNGEILLCSDRPPFLGRDHHGAAQLFCHELQHVLQQAPCTKGGRNPKVKPDCLTLLKEEMVAYHCAGQCTNPDACAALAATSSSNVCKREDIVRYINDRDSVFWKWVEQNLDKFIDKTICRGIVYERSDSPR